METPMYRPDNVTVTMPPGEYFLGDPCYVLRQSTYKAMKDSGQGPNRFEIDGHHILSLRTGCGDGSYPGTDGFDYSVDSGRIGLVPTALADPGQGLDFGTVVTFEGHFTCKADYVRKVLSFGNIRINVG